MIRLAGLASGQSPVGTSGDDLKEMMQHTEAALGLRSHSISKNDLKEMIKEEYNNLLKEMNEDFEKVGKKLEDLRVEMFKANPANYFIREREGSEFLPRMEKRIQLETVAELIDVPVNELMLYLLNCTKASNGHQLIEYHLHAVYFYAN